jgi:hypothetical protein
LAALLETHSMAKTLLSLVVNQEPNDPDAY